MHPYLSTSVAEQRQNDFVRSAEKRRLLREADIPTPVESVRLSVGRHIVRLGTLVAGRRGWALEPRPVAPVTTTALEPAR